LKEDVILGLVKVVVILMISLVMDNNALKIWFANLILAKKEFVLFVRLLSKVNSVIRLTVLKTVIAFQTLVTIQYAHFVQIPLLLFVITVHVKMMQTVLQITV
jgi:hypothetical protein